MSKNFIISTIIINVHCTKLNDAQWALRTNIYIYINKLPKIITEITFLS